MSGHDLSGLTIAAARRYLSAQFRGAGLPSPELDARLLVGDVLGLDLTGLSLSATRELTDAEAQRLSDVAHRRLRHEPVARILGTKEFWGLRFVLSPDTLVPRPETETVVEAARDFLLSRSHTDSPLRVADVGTGSGAILLALLHERRDAAGVGGDISEAALRTAQTNATQLGLGDRATFIVSDYLAALDGPFDLIVSNPPYIASAEIADLAPEVRDHDPRRALDGGADGLAAYRILSTQCITRLKAGGALMVEVGHRQATEVAGIFAAAGLRVVDPPRTDMSGIARTVTGLAPGP